MRDIAKKHQVAILFQLAHGIGIEIDDQARNPAVDQRFVQCLTDRPIATNDRVIR